MHDVYRLDRFVEAQDPVIERVFAELLGGRKRSHWMWFVFPQIAGLGRSEMARHYAVGSLTEAKAYLAHPILGPRLSQSTRLVLDHGTKPIEAIFGDIDAVKFRSSMTLFALAADAPHLFETALITHFGGKSDPGTVESLDLCPR